MMKPAPKVTKTVCTLCGLDWGLHGAKPTAEKCVELLRAELARRTVFTVPTTNGANSTASFWADWYRGTVETATNRAAKAQ